MGASGDGKRLEVQRRDDLFGCFGARALDDFDAQKKIGSQRNGPPGADGVTKRHCLLREEYRLSQFEV